MLAFVIFLFIAAIVLQRWTVKRALLGIGIDIGCSKTLVEPDESFELITNLTNQSSRFVPFLKVNLMLPHQSKVAFTRMSVKSDIQNLLWHRSTTWMSPRSKLERRLLMSLPARGRYLFRGATISGGDFLGLDETSKRFFNFNEVVVLPREIERSEVTGMLGGFVGDMSVRRFIMEDPVLTVGAREYTGREPLKQISWNHSARTGKLMAKQYDYTVEPLVSVLLDINTIKTEAEAERLQEICFSLTRGVCEYFERHHMPYDFISNAATSSAVSGWSYVAEGLGSKHLLTILEGLGRASYLPTESFGATIEKFKKTQLKDRSTIIIMPERDDEKRLLAMQGENAGQTIHFIYGEDYADEIYGGFETNFRD